PIASNLEEADDLVATAEERGCILQIGFVERFNPAVAALKGILEQPLFIEAHRLHPFFERGTDVDVILDLMIHDLDLILHLTGSPVTTIEAVGVPVLSDKIDIANARLGFADGCVANITASRVTGKTMQKIRFFGPNGYHAVDYANRQLTSLSRVRDEQGRWCIRDNHPEVISRDPLEEEIRSFLRSVRERTTPAVSAREGREALALALAIRDRIRTIPQPAGAVTS
ncbi:MAG: Gfo/Idh/MocA family oxidoreductase, partial [Syntrophales bacterium]|nr:Gfo/Idh/MocA family oxidoreductase [Syntrophales bacterium]